MNTRLISILKELMAAKVPLTSDYLSRKIQVTSRTVRNDMKELDATISKHGAAISSVRGTGYELVVKDDRRFRSFLNEIVQSSFATSPSTSEERVLYVIRKLLLSDQCLKPDDLAKELYVSKSTIQNVLREVRKVLRKYDIGLETRTNFGLKVTGDELKLRFCISDYLFCDKEGERDIFLEQLPNITSEELSIIRHITLQQMKEHDINLSDIGFNNLVTHLAIACVRIRNKNYLTLHSLEFRDIFKEPEFEVATEMVKQIADALQVVFPPFEIAYVTIHLLGNKIISQPIAPENLEEIKQLLDQEAYDLTMKILESIESNLQLGVSDDKELLIGIAMHLKPAIHRHIYGMNIRNPMVEAIKKTYPIAFKAGILASIVLKQEKEIMIDENEIGYIALHIGAAIERRKTNHEVKRCMIVCASGVGSAAFLKYKLQAEFGTKLNIVGTTEYYRLKEIPFHTLDFIISTIPISDKLPIPVVEVAVLLGKNDFDKITVALKGESMHTLDFTREELVFLQQKFETKAEVLQFLVTKLQELGLVDGTFMEAIEEREAYSPTSFGNLVAIPHPITPKTASTFWAICTLQKPIDWGGKMVQFVCLLCVEKECTEDLKNMYELLIHIIDNEKYVQELLQCETYQELEEVFLRQ